MRRRSNPWPSLVDLFSALLLATLGGLIILWGRGGTEIQKKAHELMEEVAKTLRAGKIAGSVVLCGEDTCLNFYVHFDTNKDVIDRPDELKTLRTACEALKNALDNLRRQRPNYVDSMQLIVEGHADRRPPKHATDRRTFYLYNWKLSAARAAAVLYEFKSCGLEPPRYAITAVAKGDTEPLCNKETDDCYAQNRRTTLRLQVDTRKIVLTERATNN